MDFFLLKQFNDSLNDISKEILKEIINDTNITDKDILNKYIRIQDIINKLNTINKKLLNYEYFSRYLHKYITYRDIKNAVVNFSEEQLDCNITIKDLEDEFHMATIEFADNTTDVLDEGHPYLSIKKQMSILI